jgi:Protein of unknown function (DUF1003)
VGSATLTRGLGRAPRPAANGSITFANTGSWPAVIYPWISTTSGEPEQNATRRSAVLVQSDGPDRLFHTFAGSMNFVYLHVVLFTVWMLFIERSPWPTLTLIVSLEAIFLSTFVMIGQNRQAAFQQARRITTSTSRNWSSRPTRS